VYITHITLKNFRCFEALDLEINSPVVVIEGPNGSGKSSLLEALYYACYLKSFRTHRAGDVARHGDNSSFFLKLQGLLASGDTYSLQVGFEEGVKRVKVNEAVIQSYKELMDYYRVVAISEHDLSIIQGEPEERRAFINQLTLLLDASTADLLREHKHIVAQREQLLLQGTSLESDHLALWTKQLWESSQLLVERRKQGLLLLQKKMEQLAGELGIELPPIKLEYRQKGGDYESFATFWSALRANTLMREIQQRRTLFGAHLDDISIEFGGKNARLYASRGQQKLILLLLKSAVIKVLMANEDRAERTILFLLDDFVTDLDKRAMEATIKMVESLGCGLIFTCPLAGLIQIKRAHQIITLR